MTDQHAQALEALKNFEITGPDADGLVWLVLHGNGTTGKAMFQLGTAARAAVQTALLLEADRKAALSSAAPAAGEVAFDRMRHIANEWADMATNGMQWLRNIKEGISTVEDAIENMASNYAHCRQVNDAPPAPSATSAGSTVMDEKGEQAPPNSLPGWGECAMRVENSDFIAKRVAEGGYGAEPDSKLAAQLHRFIYEYDDAEPYRSSWFLHRLELLINEVRDQARAALSQGGGA